MLESVLERSWLTGVHDSVSFTQLCDCILLCAARGGSEEVQRCHHVTTALLYHLNEANAKICIRNGVVIRIGKYYDKEQAKIDHIKG